MRRSSLRKCKKFHLSELSNFVDVLLTRLADCRRGARALEGRLAVTKKVQPKNGLEYTERRVLLMDDVDTDFSLSASGHKVELRRDFRRAPRRRATLSSMVLDPPKSTIGVNAGLCLALLASSSERNFLTAHSRMSNTSTALYSFPRCFPVTSSMRPSSSRSSTILYAVRRETSRYSRRSGALK